MTASKFDSIESYLDSLDHPIKAKTLQAVMDSILSQFPDLESKISWNVPQIHRQGKYVFGLAALKNHLTLAPWSPQLIIDFQERLSAYVVKKNCFQIPIDWEIDPKLLRDLVNARLAELDKK